MKTLRMPTFVMALAAFPLAAAAQEACSTYTVKDGDTLASIAQAAYGTFDFQDIFNANRDALAANPNELPPGLQLILPCETGALSEGTELGEVAAAETEKASKRKKNTLYEPPLKFVTANGWPPFTDSAMEGGGMLNKLAMTSLMRGGNDREATLEWVDDWDSHLEVLLPTGAFDISVAWDIPKCEEFAELEEEEQFKCSDFDFSLPVYEVAFSLFSLANNKYATAPDVTSFEGARICRPADWEIDSLEELGLVEPIVTMVEQPTLRDCAEAVLNGEADVYADSLETGLHLFEDLGAADTDIAVNPYLVNFESLHFLVAKNNPRGRIYLAMVNRGLTEMRETGEWYDIIAASLEEFNAN